VGGRRCTVGTQTARRTGPPRPWLRPGHTEEPHDPHADRPRRPAAELARRLPARAWQRLSAGPGAKGHRWNDWAFDAADPAVTEGGGPHRLLIRRRIIDGEYAFYRAHPLTRCRWPGWSGSQGRDGKVEDGFAGGKELAALDEHQVRSWTSWHRWTTLTLLAHAFLSVLASQPGGGHPDADPLIPLTRHEIRRLFTGLGQQQRPAPDPAALVPMAMQRGGIRAGAVQGEQAGACLVTRGTMSASMETIWPPGNSARAVTSGFRAGELSLRMRSSRARRPSWPPSGARPR
jgi:hypothetical protein